MLLKVPYPPQRLGKVNSGNESGENEVFVSCSWVMLSISLSCDYYLEAVDPLPARSRNAGDAVATRGYQGVSGIVSTDNC